MIVTALPSDVDIVAAVRDGARTEVVADRLGWLVNRPRILRALKRLERDGKVRRSKRYTYINSIYWEQA